MVSKELITIFLAFKFQPSVLGSEILSPAILGSKKNSKVLFFQKESILDWRSYHLDTFGEHGRYTRYPSPKTNGWNPQKNEFFGLMFALFQGGKSSGSSRGWPGTFNKILEVVLLSKPSICQTRRQFECIYIHVYIYMYK